MNAQDLTFGIEIETIAPNRAVQNDGLRIHHEKRWRAQHRPLETHRYGNGASWVSRLRFGLAGPGWEAPHLQTPGRGRLFRPRFFWV